MNKNIVKLTESKLKQIVAESVKKVLKEGTNYDELEKAYEILNQITKSSFIPFSSPHPSSTEIEIKNAIIEAMRLIDKAKYLSAQLGYHQPRINVV